MTSPISHLSDKDNVKPLVWYASYGSNMHRERFACYITGGIPPGGIRNHAGCTNKTLPIRNMAVELPHELYFTGESKVWTGGFAAIGHTIGQGSTKGRAYLITKEQLEQVAAQESWRDEPLSLDLARLRAAGRVTMGDGQGSYDEMIYCGEHDGYPIISMTAPHEQRPLTKPAPVYLRMIARGLAEAHSLTPYEVSNYLISKPGIAGNYTLEDILTIIA